MAWFLYLLVFLIPLGRRHLLGSAIFGVHEYEAFFVYVLDLVVVVLLLLYALHRDERKERPSPLILVALGLFVFCACLSLIYAPSTLLSAYHLIRLLLLIGVAFATSAMARRRSVFMGCLTAIIAAAVIQAGIGVGQFALQRDLGLQKFGEPVLLSYKGPTSTIRADGGRFLRAYGTFPHPNILGGFLVLGLLIAGYCYLNARRYLARAGLAGVTFLLVLGLALTFSRSAWIAALVALLSYLALLWRRKERRSVLRLFVLCGGAALVIYLLLAPIIIPRAELSPTEPAVTDRLAYAKIGFEIARDNPLGVGIGNQVLYGVNDSRYTLHGLRSVWQWEPVHNIYLLAADEIGWLGGLSFVVFLAILLWQLAKQHNGEAVLSFSLLAALLAIGLFDHYLWDIEPGRLMLWVVIGLALSQIGKRPSSFNG